MSLHVFRLLTPRLPTSFFLNTLVFKAFTAENQTQTASMGDNRARGFGAKAPRMNI